MSGSEAETKMKPNRAAIEAPRFERCGPRRPITRLAAMLGRTRIVLLAGLLMLGIAGCGGDDGTIPKDNSEELLGLLSTLENQIETGDCTLAEGTAEQVDAAVKKLPSGVDPKVQEALNQGAANLTNLTPEQCGEGATGASGVQTTDESSTSTSTTTTTTSTETTTPTDTTATEDPTEQPPQGTPPGQQTPPGNGGGNQGGNTGTQGGGGDEGGAPPSGGVEGKR